MPVRISISTTAQLARRLEVSSDIRGECPNHVADLVTRLTAFEDHELTCANATEADRDVHAKLFELTVQARRHLEEALTLVISDGGLSACAFRDMGRPPMGIAGRRDQASFSARRGPARSSWVGAGTVPKTRSQRPVEMP